MRPLRIVYLAGPGDAFQTFHSWKEGVPDPTASHVTYSSQFYDVCRELDAAALVLTSNDHLPSQPEGDGRIRVEQRPDWLAGGGGVRFHARQWRAAQSVARDVERFGANVLVTTETPYLFLLGDLKRHGVSVIQALHCTLWTPQHATPIGRRIALHLLGRSYSRTCDAVLAVSDEISRQVSWISAHAGSPPPPIVGFLPHYEPHMYDGLPPSERSRPFHIVFAGRVEANKGVFNVLEVARRLRNKGRTEVIFDICGVGSAFDELRARKRALGLEKSFVLHGWCDREKLRAEYGRCQAVIVPTTTEFVEGFNKVVVESILAGKPVIVSDACPALEYVAESCLEVPADDLGAYERAIERLVDEPATYERLRAACHSASLLFFDPETSYRSAMRHVLTAIRAGRRVTDRRVHPNSEPHVTH